MLGDNFTPPIELKRLGGRVVVYTAILGKYDKLLPIDNVSDDVDYICLTNCKPYESSPLPWKVIQIDNKGLSDKDLARFCKINVASLFPHYEISIWVDGNIGIIGDIPALLREHFKDKFVAAYEHWGRVNIEQEIYTCARIGHDAAWKLRRQLDRYKKSSYPFKELYETNVVIRRHNEPVVVEAMSFWWREYATEGKRDQYSFTYAMHLSSLAVHSLGESDPRMVNQFFTYHPHIKTQNIRLLFKGLVNKIYMYIVGWTKPDKEN